MSDQPRKPAADMDSWHLGRLLTAAARMLEQAFDADIAELGITHAGVRVLDVLGDGALPQHEVAIRCQVQDQTLSRIIDRLERDGHVARRRDGKDRRKVFVERTGAGETVLERAQQISAAHLDAFTDSADDTVACRRALIKIIERLGNERWGCG
jgi:MarR family transcriptional regulator, organic hydroperoxide resistance regulator